MKKSTNIKKEKDFDKIALITLLVIVVIELIMIITLIAIGVRKIVPLMLLVIPTLIACVAIFFLSRNVLFESRRRKKKVSVKINV